MKTTNIYFYINKTIEKYENITDVKFGFVRAKEISFRDKSGKYHKSVGIPYRIEEALK